MISLQRGKIQNKNNDNYEEDSNWDVISVLFWGGLGISTLSSESHVL